MVLQMFSAVMCKCSVFGRTHVGFVSNVGQYISDCVLVGQCASDEYLEYVRESVCVCACGVVCSNSNMYVCVWACVYVCVHDCVCVCVCVCACMSVCVYLSAPTSDHHSPSIRMLTGQSTSGHFSLLDTDTHTHTHTHKHAHVI